MSEMNNRRFVAKVVARVLRDAGFVQASVPRFNHGFPKDDTHGFWIVTSHRGPGTLFLTAVLAPNESDDIITETRRYNLAYLRVLRTAFDRAIGAQASRQYLALRCNEVGVTNVVILTPSDQHLRQLRRAFHAGAIWL